MKTFVILILLVLLAGCKGTPTKGEKEARRQVQAVAGSYRPEGRKPELPVLTSQSSLSNFLTYALLNQPQVEAAYFDWLASVERITVQRSLPDPQLTFQMDIQDVVTSVMPGLMMSLPGLGKLRAAGAVAAGRKPGQVLRVQGRFPAERLRREARLLPALLSGGEDPGEPRDPEPAGRPGEDSPARRTRSARSTLQDVLRAQIEQDRLKNRDRQPRGLAQSAAGPVQGGPGHAAPTSRRRPCRSALNPRRWT